MIIEYFGLPGSGKTYHARRYAALKNARFIEISGRRERYFYALVFVILHPFSTLFFLKEICVETQGRKALLWHKIFLVFPDAIACEEKARCTHGDSVVDQGLLQLLLGVYEKRVEKMRLTDALKFFPSGDW